MKGPHRSAQKATISTTSHDAVRWVLISCRSFRFVEKTKQPCHGQQYIKFESSLINQSMNFVHFVCASGDFHNSGFSIVSDVQKKDTHTTEKTIVMKMGVPQN